MKQLKTNDFIKKAIKVHGEKYDYSNINYTNTKSKLEIICKEHGSFFQRADHHISGSGCRICSGSNTSTTSEFIDKAIKVHGDKYDYSKVEYKNTDSKVYIICKKHGSFFQSPYNHLSGNGCSKCSGMYSPTTLEFISKAKAIEVHGDKYDYSLVKYTNASSKVKIICPEHGEFSQVANSHLSGHGCLICSGEQSSKRQVSTKSEFLIKAIKVHGEKFDYSKVEYITAKSKVEIICKEHGSFWQTVDNHLKGRGCLICSGKQTSTTLDFIEKAKKVHEDNYDYSKVSYLNAKSKVEICCLEHGSFFQVPNSHLHGKGCPKCKSSRGEQEIRNHLQNINATFVEQYRIKECRNKLPLPFDFAVFENEKLSYLIEFDGIQHFLPVNYFGGVERLYGTQKNDSIKTKYCIDNNIKLVRIKYNEEIKSIWNI